MVIPIKYFIRSFIEQMIKVLKTAPDRWLPLLIASCGMPMAYLVPTSRNTIMERLWDQIVRHRQFFYVVPRTLSIFRNPC